MKLYATITSERASKGQGGKELDIEILNEKREVIASIKIDTDIQGKARMGVFYEEEKSHTPLVATMRGDHAKYRDSEQNYSDNGSKGNQQKDKDDSYIAKENNDFFLKGDNMDYHENYVCDVCKRNPKYCPHGDHRSIV